MAEVKYPPIIGGETPEIDTVTTWKFDSLYMSNIDPSKPMFGYGDSNVDQNNTCYLLRRTPFISVIDSKGTILRGVNLITVGFRLNGDFYVNEDNPELVQLGIRVYLDNSNKVVRDYRDNIYVTELNVTEWINKLIDITCQSISIEVIHSSGRGFELEYIGFEPK